jgi:hypothetical protein
LQFPRLRELNAFRGEASDARRNPVNGFFPLHDPFDKLARLPHRLARAGGESDTPVLQHYLIKIPSSQVMSGEL